MTTPLTPCLRNRNTTRKGVKIVAVRPSVLHRPTRACERRRGTTRTRWRTAARPKCKSRRPGKIDKGNRAGSRMDRRAHGHQEGIFEGASDAEASLDEERRKRRDKSIDECVCHDQSGGAYYQPEKSCGPKRAEKVRPALGGSATAAGYRESCSQSNLGLVLLQHGLSFGSGRSTPTNEAIPGWLYACTRR